MPEPNFNNTEVAFAHKSDADLKKASLLFKTFSYPWLIRFGPGLASFSINIIPPIKKLIKNTIFSQFCGGESIEECHSAIQVLNEAGIGTILDYSVEGEESEEVFEFTCKEILRTIEKAAKSSESMPFAVFKVTGIAAMDLLTKVSEKQSLNKEETAAFERVKYRFNLLCQTAAEYQVKILVDAEDSWIQDVIDQMTYEAMSQYNLKEAVVYNTIQCYRTGRVEHIKGITENNHFYPGFKLVRGAYMEKERERADRLGYTSPIHIDKASTDHEFDSALLYCIENIDKVSLCAGTHNEKSSLELTRIMADKGIQNNDARVWFAQLLGMSDHISFNLAKAGYNVAKYMPYGPVKAVLPYLSRRAQENSSVKGQSGRELKLIHQELQRRKSV